jgi:cytochrome oxidase Cu insertion factor (SCO1/SenC/PrrC family)
VLVAVAVTTWLVRRSLPPPPPVLAEVSEDFQLTNRDGRTITRDDLLGRPWIADLVFTRCVLACPVMSGKMAILDRELPGADWKAEDGGEPALRIVSISVDPEHDQPEVLEKYAEKFQASDRWMFLTGDRVQIYHLAGEGLRLGYDPNPPLVPLRPGDNIYHSTRFVLVDAQGQVRGYYETLEGDDTDQLRRDLRVLE